MNDLKHLDNNKFQVDKENVFRHDVYFSDTNAVKMDGTDTRIYSNYVTVIHTIYIREELVI